MCRRRRRRAAAGAAPAEPARSRRAAKPAAPAAAKPAAAPAAKPAAAAAAKPAAPRPRNRPPRPSRRPSIRRRRRRRPDRPIRRRPPTCRCRRSSRRCRRRCPAPSSHVSYWVGDWTVIVAADRILDVMRAPARRPDAAFDLCSDVTATDWPPRAERFDVVYCLFSTRHRHRVRVKAQARRQQADCVGDGGLAGGELARARGLRHVRRQLHRTSRSAAHSDARRLAGISAAQGLSARRARASC